MALDFGANQPGGYNNDRLVVWVSNTSSSSSGVANTTAGLLADAGKMARTQNITGTVHGWGYYRMNNASGGSTGVARNITTWAGGNADPWIWKPSVPAGATVVKFSIALAQIASAVAGNELRVLVAFSAGWGNGSTNVGVTSLVPMAAAPTATSSTGSTETTITVNMNNALAYTVK